MPGMSRIDHRSLGQASLGSGLSKAPMFGGADRRLGQRMLGEAIAILAGTLCGIAAAVLGFWAEH